MLQCKKINDDADQAIHNATKALWNSWPPLAVVYLGLALDIFPYKTSIAVTFEHLPSYVLSLQLLPGRWCFFHSTISVWWYRQVQEETEMYRLVYLRLSDTLVNIMSPGVDWLLVCKNVGYFCDIQAAVDSLMPGLFLSLYRCYLGEGDLFSVCGGCFPMNG